MSQAQDQSSKGDRHGAGLQAQRLQSALRLQAAARGLNVRQTSHRQQVLFGVEKQLPTAQACSNYKDELKKYVDTMDMTGSFPQTVQRKPNATGVLFRACDYQEGRPILPSNPGSRVTLQGHVGCNNNGSAYISLTVDLQAALYYAGNDDHSAIVVVLAERCFGVFFPSYDESFRKTQGWNQLQANYRPNPNASHEVDLLGIVPPQAVIHVFKTPWRLPTFLSVLPQKCQRPAHGTGIVEWRGNLLKKFDVVATSAKPGDGDGLALRCTPINSKKACQHKCRLTSDVSKICKHPCCQQWRNAEDERISCRAQWVSLGQVPPTSPSLPTLNPKS